MGGSIDGGASAGSWSGEAGTWINAINLSTVTYRVGASETESGSVTLTATVGCATVTANKKITITALPSTGTLSGTQGICVSGLTTFSSTVSGGTWGSSNTEVANINTSTGEITGVSAGTVTMTYTKSGSGGCSDDTVTRTVTVATPKIDASSNGSRSGEGLVSIQAKASASSID